MASCLGHLKNVYNIDSSSNGVSDMTQIRISTLLNAWSSACGNDSGGTVNVPSGTFKLNTVTFQGPCKGIVSFKVNGILQAPSDSKGGADWIKFSNVYGLQISGSGTFDGQGSTAWKHTKCNKGSSQSAICTTSLKFNDVKNATIQGITSLNSKFFHLAITRCENFSINEITITAPEDSPNTDGIHISNSNKVQVTNVKIGTGDDCISLGPGSTNINISSVKCGPGHGISIGSLGTSSDELPVQGVTVSDSSFTGTQNGARIKTFGSSVSNNVSDVIFQNIDVNDVKNPIIIDQHYCPGSSCEQKGDSLVRISNVKFINIKGTSTSDVSVQLNCSESVPCQEIELQDLKLTRKDGQATTKATCSNFKGTFEGDQDPPNCSNTA
ncbi:hypothetical protein Leryth_006546 [Lithospermum erythrorhizon]|nr:hypothetical protein Leryth_006546 [Lithospermum erythrorhizon]